MIEVSVGVGRSKVRVLMLCLRLRYALGVISCGRAADCSTNISKYARLSTMDSRRRRGSRLSKTPLKLGMQSGANPCWYR
jgi:hypothetical protein